MSGYVMVDGDRALPTPPRRGRRAFGRGLVLTAGCGALLSLAACGGSDSSNASNGGSTNAAATTAGDSTSAAKWQAKLDALYKGTMRQPPATSPKPQPGKKIAVISLAQNLPASATASEEAAAAAKAMGWKASIFDGKADSNAQLGAVRQAIAQKADGIVLVYIDCAPLQAALSEARKAGIKVVGLEANDCSNAKPGAPSLFDYVSTYVGKEKFPEFIKEAGADAQVWNVVQNKEKAKVLLMAETSVLTDRILTDGARAMLKECTTCPAPVTLKHTFADLGPALQQKAQQAVLQHPDINGVSVSSDSILTAGGLLAAIRASGHRFKVMGGECATPNLDLIRKNQGQDACLGFSIPWEAWSAVDGLNRVFNNEDPYAVDTGNGLLLVDRAHNLPASGPFDPGVDFRAAYKQAWGAAT